ESIGTVHHVAWRTPDPDTQVAWRDTLLTAGRNVTPVIDRWYFKSIYYREPAALVSGAARSARRDLAADCRADHGDDRRSLAWSTHETSGRKLNEHRSYRAGQPVRGGKQGHRHERHAPGP